MSLPDELWVLAAGVLLAGVRLVIVGRRRRWRTLIDLAAERGLSFSRRDRSDLPEELACLELMRHGYNRRASDVLSTGARRTAGAFCYHYEAGFGKRHRSHELTVSVARTEKRHPGIWIARRREMENAGFFGRYRRVETAAWLSDAALRVYAEDAGFARAVLTDEVRTLLQRGEAVPDCEIRGPYVALYNEGIAGPEAQIDLLRRAEALATVVDRLGKGGGDGAVGAGAARTGEAVIARRNKDNDERPLTGA